MSGPTRGLVADDLNIAIRPALLGARRMSRQSVNAIETGKFDPSLPVAFRLVRLFDLTIEDIFADDE